MRVLAPAAGRLGDSSRARSVAWGRAAVLLILGLVCLAQLGCGFRLRGVVEIPAELNPVYIQAAGNSPVSAALVDQLAGGDVTLAATAGEAKLILRILSESRYSQVVAVDSGGRVLAYELHYLVSYDAVTPDGAQKVPGQSLDLIRNFDNPDVEVLGKQLEEELIYQDFARDAADRILMRLRVTLL
ncbi:LPS assembly lipoprotein LptE [Thiocapsa sp.]|uniref:LPS-assembly lipoprotein LptE n=1 Tax=Thiocapsa sp. TaxID=2024551 RepID=UPI002C0AF986|nr:LPS assembly lipoprotein LptE [Thiocapsa sp.]HSO81412.1 LPS assembly lipoprotein LptE [Thiocapsa sp.]